MVVISASIQIVDVEAESKPLVDIHRKIRFETLFSVYFVTCFVIGQIRIWNIAIGKIKLIRPHEEERIWLHEDSWFYCLPVKEDTRHTWSTHVA